MLPGVATLFGVLRLPDAAPCGTLNICVALAPDALGDGPRMHFDHCCTYFSAVSVALVSASNAATAWRAATGQNAPHVAGGRAPL